MAQAITSELNKAKQFLSTDDFKRLDILVGRAFSTEINKYKFVQSYYERFNILTESPNKKLRNSLLFLLNQVKLEANKAGNIDAYLLLTTQEHVFAGSTVSKSNKFKSPYLPVGCLLGQITIEQAQKGRNIRFVSRTTGLSYFGLQGEIPGLRAFYAYYLLEPLDEKGDTVCDPRPIDFDKLNSLAFKNPAKFETMNFDEIYQNCKITYCKANFFPYARDLTT